MDAAEVERQLRALEPVFHRSPPGSSRDVFERMTASAYWEVGASGTVYDRATAIGIVTRRYATGRIDPDPLTVTDFLVTRLDGGAWLVTYQLKQGAPRG
jgi:hypothetical protein